MKLGFKLLPWGVLTLACLALFAFFLVYPLASIFVSSVRDNAGNFSLVNFVNLAVDGTYRRAFVNSLLLGGSVTVFATLIGVPFAYMVARYDFPFKNTVSVLPILVIVIPEIIVGQSWLLIFGNNGIITNALYDLDIEMPSFYGWTGMIFSMTLVYYIYIYLGTLAALRGFDGQLEEAGLSLGTAPLKTKLRVLLPVILPAIIVNALLVFTLVIGNFSLAILLGSRVPLLSVMTYNTFLSEMGGNPAAQSAMSVVSIAIVAFALFVQRQVIERKSYTMTQGRAPRAEPVRSWAALLFTGFMGLVVALSMLPLVVVVIGAFTATSGPVMKWGQWSLDNLAHVLRRAPEPVWNSLKFASMATLVSVVIAVVVSYLVIRQKSILTKMLDYITVIPLTISGTVLGIALMQTFNSGAIVLSGSAAIMVLCYTVRKLPFGVRNASSTLFNIPVSIEEASISLGVSPLRTFVKIILPAMSGSIASAAILTWVTTISELSASIVVYTGGLETMPIEIFRQVDGGRLGTASAYGAVLMALILVPIIVAVKMFRLNLFSKK
jgi:iron(III) transport system permease protein